MSPRPKAQIIKDHPKYTTTCSAHHSDSSSLWFILYRSTIDEEDSAFYLASQALLSFRPIWLHFAWEIKQFCFEFRGWWLSEATFSNKAKPKTLRCGVSIFAQAQFWAHLTDIPSTYKTGDKKKARHRSMHISFQVSLTLRSNSVNAGISQHSLTVWQIIDCFRFIE